MRYRCFGARHVLGQLVRIEAGFRALGWVEAGDNDPNVDLIYANDEPRWQEAIEYRDRVQPKAKLILCVLDIPEWNLPHGFNPYAWLPQLQKADAVVSISQYVQSQLIRYYGIMSSIVYQPIKGVSPSKRLSGNKPYPYRYVLAGRLSDPVKNGSMAVKALLMTGVEEKEVAIVGGDSLGFGTNLGVVDDVTLNDIYNSVDFVMCLSSGGGLELPPLEGICAGAIPIVTSSLTTFPEFYPSSWGCYPNAHSVAYRLRSLIDNPALMKTDKSYCLEYAPKLSSLLSGRSVASRIFDVYNTIS